MRVYVDGLEKSWKTTEGATLEQVIQEVGELLVVESRRLITSVKIGDVKPGLDMSLTPDQVSAGDIDTIEFSTQDIRESLDGDLTRALERLETAKSVMTEVINHIVADEIEPAMTKVRTFIEGLIWFTSLLRQLNAIGIQFEGIMCGEVNMNEYIDRLNNVLVELTDAMENGDYTLINDYLEYELGPAIDVLSESVKPLREALEKIY